MTNIDQYRLNRIDELIEKNKELQETILDYSARVNMYEIKVGRLRRTIGEYMDKYDLQLNLVEVDLVTNYIMDEYVRGKISTSDIDTDEDDKMYTKIWNDINEAIHNDEK